jgi:hypothetical protein
VPTLGGQATFYTNARVWTRVGLLETKSWSDSEELYEHIKAGEFRSQPSAWSDLVIGRWTFRKEIE